MATTTMFNDLPTELKLLIFSFFDSEELNEKVAKICKNWRFLSCDPYIWRKLYIDQEEITPEEIIKILNRNQFLRRIDFLQVLDFNWINYVDKHSSIRIIKFKFCRLSNSILRVIDIFPNIEKVAIGYCEDVPDIVLQLTRWNLLKSFKIIGGRCALSLFAERTEHLEKMSFHACSEIDLETIIKLRGKNLKFLHLSTAYKVNIKADTYQLISKTCDNLTELKLSNLYLLTPQNLLMFTNLSSLKILHLNSVSLLFSSSFSSTFKEAQFSSLTELVISNCFQMNDECLESIVKCCPRLTDLSINRASLITNAGLQCLPNLCRNLELLILGQVDGITEECLKDVVLQLPKLCYCITFPSPFYIKPSTIRRIVDKPKSRMFLRRNKCDWYRY